MSSDSRSVSRSGLNGQAPEIGQARVKEELRLARIRADILIAAAKQYITDGTIFEGLDTKEKLHAQLEKEVPLDDFWWGWWIDKAWNGKPPRVEIIIPVESFEEKWEKLSETAKSEYITDFDISNPVVAELEELPDSELKRLTDAYKIRHSKDGVFNRATVIKLLVDIGLSARDIPPA